MTRVSVAFPVTRSNDRYSRDGICAPVTLVVDFSKLVAMKFRFVLVLVTFVVVTILATRRPRIVRPPAERGTWTPVPSDR